MSTVLRLGLERARIELLTFFRDRSTVIFTFSFPIVMLLIFGAVFGDEDLGGGVTYARYFTAGMVASGVFTTSFQYLAIAIAAERSDGTLKRLRGTPLPPASFFLGKVGVVVVAGALQCAILVVCAVVTLDLDLPEHASAWLRLAWVLPLGATAGTLVGIAYSSVPRTGRAAAAVVSPVLVVLQFISGVYFVHSSLPEWMRVLGEVFPLAWLARGMRSVFLPDAAAATETGGTWASGTTAAVLAAWAVVGLVLSLRTFRWRADGDG